VIGGIRGGGGGWNFLGFEGFDKLFVGNVVLPLNFCNT
jgi:hypothetical protein